MSSKCFFGNHVQGRRVIHTASSFAKQNLIYLQEVGSSNYLQPYSSWRSNLSSYLFFIVREGEGVMRVHESNYYLSKGSCALIDCRNSYTISTDKKLWTLDWIHFNGLSMNNIYQKYLERCGTPCFVANIPKNFFELHEQIYDMAESDSYVKDMELMKLLSGLLAELMGQCWNGNQSPEMMLHMNDWKNVKEYIDEHYFEEINLDSLATVFCVNKYHLVRKFKETFGSTVNQYITNERVTHAKELLRFTDYTITEIGTKIGFNDGAYFTRVFKKEEGISPSEFRKQWQNNKVNIIQK